MLRVENVATPATAATVVVPESVPFAGFVPNARVTAEVKPVTVLPPASSALTVTAGVIVAPAVVGLGGKVNASWLAAPPTTSNGALVAPVNPFAANASA